MVEFIKSNEEFKEKVENSKVPVVVDFYADWCAPCRMLVPIYEKLSEEYGDKVKFVKLNVDELQDLAMRFNVMSIPTIILFKNGEIAGQQVGALPEPILKGWIDSLIE